MDYKVLDMEKYYRKDIYRHFTMECKCSIMITSKIYVSDLVAYSKQTGTKFYINFLYVLTKALNTRDDYKMRYLYQEDKLVVFDKINTAHYVFHVDTETFTVVYTEFSAASVIKSQIIFAELCINYCKSLRILVENIMRSVDFIKHD